MKCAGMLTGKYEVGRALPKGPRALLFRQILPGLAPLLAELRSVAAARGKTPSQVGALAPGSTSVAQGQGHSCCVRCSCEA